MSKKISKKQLKELEEIQNLRFQCESLNRALYVRKIELEALVNTYSSLKGQLLKKWKNFKTKWEKLGEKK